MLGDFRTLDMDVIAGGGANRKAFLQRVQQYLAMWETNPKAVSADRIVKDFDYLHPLTLRGSGLVVTYGELNTLADYLATPGDLDSRSEADLLPILQQVRQEGYAWTTWVIEDEWLKKDLVFGGFEGSVANTLGSETADALWETLKMNSHTEQWALTAWTSTTPCWAATRATLRRIRGTGGRSSTSRPGRTPRRHSMPLATERTG